MIEWYRYRDDIDPQAVPTYITGPILIANVFSKNGAYGVAYVIKLEEGYKLDAGSNLTGRSWKSPDGIYDTIEQAIEIAERTWRPG